MQEETGLIFEWFWSQNLTEILYEGIAKSTRYSPWQAHFVFFLYFNCFFFFNLFQSFSFLC